ncbi:MAG TPA: YdcF family protein [Pyrinomonadaceae bacterium]|jgi:vancomycin permeability regulator SanA
MHKRRKKLLLAPLLLLPAVFLLGAALLVADGLRDDIRPADVAIVLGNTVERDGRPSARLRARLDKAVELHRAGLFGHVIVSGGVGAEGFNEAEVMKRYLVGQGVPEDRVIADGEGLTTALTARNAARLMKEQGWRSALVISQYFHVPRTRLAVEGYGVRPVYSAHAEYFELRDVYSIAREVIGYGAYLARGYD